MNLRLPVSTCFNYFLLVPTNHGGVDRGHQGLAGHLFSAQHAAQFSEFQGAVLRSLHHLGPSRKGIHCKVKKNNFLGTHTQLL